MHSWLCDYFFRNSFWRKKTNEDEILDIYNVKKTDVSSEEFFMRKSQVNYIKKVLSPVRAMNLKSSNLNNINNSMMSNSSKKLPLKINSNKCLLSR